MGRYAYLYWDLDGTLTDPREGIVRCVRYALAGIGVDPGSDSLEHFIGPPLEASFSEHFGLRGADLSRAVALYRERFEQVGWRENRPIAGVASLLGDLKAAGTVMAVATAKPTPYAERILAHFGLRSFFTAVYGSRLGEPGWNKTAVLQRALAGRAAETRAGTAMIGDHPDDLQAARACGVAGVAVTYGYGREEALAALRPAALVHDVAELRAWLTAASPVGGR
jgi:phosphoglycolate phosphatase